MEEHDVSNLTEFLKPRWLTFVTAFIAAPFFFMWLGWLVPAGDVARAESSVLLSYKAQQCAQRALADTAVTPEMLSDFSQRRKVAETHAMMPGEEATDPKVRNECSSLLAG